MSEIKPALTADGDPRKITQADVDMLRQMAAREGRGWQQQGVAPGHTANAPSHL